MTLVLDASAAVELLLGTARGRRVADHLAGPDVLCPELLDVEVASATARLQRAGTLRREEADDVIARLALLPVERVPHALLLAPAWSLREGVRVADAFYVACAQITRSALLTCDARFARTPLGTVSVTVVH